MDCRGFMQVCYLCVRSKNSSRAVVAENLQVKLCSWLCMNSAVYMKSSNWPCMNYAVFMKTANWPSMNYAVFMKTVNWLCLSYAVFMQAANDVKKYLVFGIVFIISSCSTIESAGVEQGSINSVSNSSHNSAYKQLAQADAAYDSENWLQASTLYKEIVNIIPNDAYAWFRLGNSLTQLGQYGSAVNAYETSLSADNGQFKAWFNLSTTHLLSAKVVTLNALRSLGLDDPSRTNVKRRLDILTALLN